MPCRVNLSLGGDWLKSQFSTSVFKKNMKLMTKWIPHFSLSFQEIRQGIAFSISLISKRNTANDPELARVVKLKKLRDSHHELGPSRKTETSHCRMQRAYRSRKP